MKPVVRLGRNDATDWVAGAGYVVISAQIQRGGPYQVFPRLNRTGSSYPCTGSALKVTNY